MMLPLLIAWNGGRPFAKGRPWCHDFASAMLVLLDLAMT